MTTLKETKDQGHLVLSIHLFTQLISVFSPKVTLTMLYYVEERQMTLFIIGLVQLAYFFSASFVKVKQVTPTGLPLSSLAAVAAAAAAAPTHTYIALQQ